MNISHMGFAFIYGFIGGQWAYFANKEQTRLYGFCWWRNLLVIIVNFVFWPICMVIAKLKGRI